ncbi:sigma-70 family RNA polymerase sigma factor [Cellulomonas soli]
MDRDAELGPVNEDAGLIAATRDGDSGAFGQLYQRHAGAAWVVARQYVDSRADADDVVAEAFTAVYSALVGGSGPDVAFRAYLFTVVRRTAAARRAQGARAVPTDDERVLEAAAVPAAAAEEPVLAGLEGTLVAGAYRSLPERWQAVLWYTEVEGLAPAKVAPLLGLTANGVAALAYRAREGLRQAYLQEHLSGATSDGCRDVHGLLGAYVRGGLAVRDTRRVETHLDECGPCRTLVLELGDVNHGMRGVIAPSCWACWAWVRWRTSYRWPVASPRVPRPSGVRAARAVLAVQALRPRVLLAVRAPRAPVPVRRARGPVCSP